MMVRPVSGPTSRFHEVWEPEMTRHDRFMAPASPPSRPSSRMVAVLSRLRGPGGLYNAGNLLALAAGLAMQARTAAGMPSESMADALWVYFFGNPGATWLTVAVVIFLASGEVYHRAWQGASPPSIRLNRLGDLLSGLGASALTVSLVWVGNIPLALAAGILLAGGKFGNAAMQYPAMAGRGPAWLPRLFRQSALASRIPALAALAFELVRAPLSPAGTTLETTVMPAVMLVCTLIWCRADWLLLRDS